MALLPCTFRARESPETTKGVHAIRLLLLLVPLVGCRQAADSHRVETRWHIEAAADPRPLAADGRALFKVVGGALLGDTVIVAEQSTSEIHTKQRGGDQVGTFGRRGLGPAELGRLAWIQSIDTRLIAYDSESRRLSEWSSTGRFQRSIAFESRLGEQHTPVGVFSDSSVLVRSTIFEPRATSPRIFRPRFLLALHDSRGVLRDSLLSFMGDESYQEPRPRGGQLTLRRAFGVQTGVAVGRRGFALVGDDSAAEFRTQDGALIRRVTISAPSGADDVLAEERHVLRSRFLATAVKGRGWEEAYERMPVPRRKPRIGWSGANLMPAIRFMSSGEYWIVRFGGVTSGRIVWTVFGEDGELIREVEADQEMEILDADSRSVLARTWDADGTEQIQVWPLVPPSAS